MFSARLRLPASTTPAAAAAYVDCMLGLVELQGLAGALVGVGSGGGADAGLSLEQRKRLSIAVELCANPAVLFLDEPTSGLDAHSAAVVVAACRAVANAGRALVCTIHQPSAEVFFSFSSLLLLQPGGATIFSGDLGFEASSVVAYLSAAGARPIRPGENPAAWMLEVTSPGTTPDSQPDYVGWYAASAVAAANTMAIEAATVPSAEPLAVAGSERTAGLAQQVRALLWRNTMRYWRLPDVSDCVVWLGVAGAAGGPGGRPASRAAHQCPPPLAPPPSTLAQLLQYNGMRMLLTSIFALLMGAAFWGVGQVRGGRRGEQTAALQALPRGSTPGRHLPAPRAACADPRLRRLRHRRHGGDQCHSDRGDQPRGAQLHRQPGGRRQRAAGDVPRARRRLLLPLALRRGRGLGGGALAGGADPDLRPRHVLDDRQGRRRAWPAQGGHAPRQAPTRRLPTAPPPRLDPRRLCPHRGPVSVLPSHRLPEPHAVHILWPGLPVPHACGVGRAGPGLHHFRVLADAVRLLYPAQRHAVVVALDLVGWWVGWGGVGI